MRELAELHETSKALADRIKRLERTVYFLKGWGGFAVAGDIPVAILETDVLLSVVETIVTDGSPLDVVAAGALDENTAPFADVFRVKAGGGAIEQLVNDDLSKHGFVGLFKRVV